MRKSTLGWGLALWISGTAFLFAAGAMAGPIHDAAEAGDTAKLQQLIDSGVSPDQVRPEDDATPLHLAVFGGHMEAAELLIKDGANVNAHTTAGYTPLHLAALKGDADIAQFLIDKGAEINPVSADGETALHLAAMAGSTGVAQVLLNAGADPAVRDFQGRTAADIATSHGNQTLAKALAPSGMQTPSIYRDGTADIEKRIQQMNAAIARNKAALAKAFEPNALASPDLTGANGTSTPVTGNTSTAPQLSTADLLKAAGSLIDNSRAGSTYTPKGLDAAVAKELGKDGPAATTPTPAPGSSSLDQSLKDLLGNGADASASDAATYVPAAADESVALPSAGSVNYAVQLASVKTQDAAEQEWTRLKTAHPDLLVALNSEVTAADLGDRGTFYRLRAGPLTKDRAASICDSLAASHENCMVVRQ
jgi:hypothetical protein